MTTAKHKTFFVSKPQSLAETEIIKEWETSGRVLVLHESADTTPKTKYAVSDYLTGLGIAKGLGEKGLIKEANKVITKAVEDKHDFSIYNEVNSDEFQRGYKAFKDLLESSGQFRNGVEYYLKQNYS